MILEFLILKCVILYCDYRDACVFKASLLLKGLGPSFIFSSPSATSQCRERALQVNCRTFLLFGDVLELVSVTHFQLSAPHLKQGGQYVLKTVVMKVK
jgi:hypothetical protein